MTHNPRESTASIYSEDGELESEVPLQGSPYPLERHVIHPYLLHSLLRYLSYADVLTLLTVNKGIRHALSEIKGLREEVLERFLFTVGYTRWIWAAEEPLVLSLKVCAPFEVILGNLIIKRVFFRILTHIFAVFQFLRMSTPPLLMLS